MKRKTLVPVLLVFVLCAAGARAYAQEQPVQAELERPFALALGEKARVEPDGLEVTLRSMSEDSGCDDPSDCTSYLFKGTLLLRLGDQKEMGEIMAFFKPGQPYTQKFAGYQIEMTSIRRVQRGGPLLVTFQVAKAPPEEEKQD